VKTFLSQRRTSAPLASFISKGFSRMAKVKQFKDLLRFHCPGCEDTHMVRVGVPGAWGWNGSLDRPTITPSILVNRGKANPMFPVCHSFVREGRIEFCSDCDHPLAGQTVELPELAEPDIL
jgi:hypothetical protein